MADNQPDEATKNNRPAKRSGAASTTTQRASGDIEAVTTKSTRRAIPGNMPYLGTYKRLGDALRGLINAERPQKFNEDFLGTVLQIRGGSARPIPPILKRVGMLNPDNSPTELYSKFKSDSSRPAAALQALRNGYAEIFKRNEYAHRESDERIKDIVVEITGLKKADPIVNAILGTFNVFREYTKGVTDEASHISVKNGSDVEVGASDRSPSMDESIKKLNLVNTINVVLPETTDVQVYNAIFRSIRENLLL